MPDYDDEYLHEIECVEESVRAEERENLRRQIDWLAKALVRYADACPLEISRLYDEEADILKIPGCDGASWPADDYFDCSEHNPEKCWKEAARRAVEEEDDAK